MDAGLQVVIEAWPTLPEAVRKDILAMVEPTGMPPGEGASGS
jgi:hypothetical protein